MPRIFRAAAMATAALGFFTAGASASQGDPAPALIDHAAAAVTAADLSLDPLDAPPPDAAAPSPEPVATHATAPLLTDSPHPAEASEERDGRSLAELVDDYAAVDTPDEETDCLARAVYYESKGEPLAGQLTVAEVIINRARSGRFAPTVCGVVRQPSQFSFVRRGHIPTPPRASRDWRIAVAIARIAMEDLADGQAPRALFFHARHVRPGWRLTRVATVGNHVFYR